MAGSINCDQEQKEKVIKKCKLIADWKDEELCKSQQKRRAYKKNDMSSAFKLKYYNRLFKEGHTSYQAHGGVAISIH